MTERVSVALATFNGREFVASQLRSILRQSRPVDEIVIADDGSTDGTLDIAAAELTNFSGTVTVLEPLSEPLRVTANFARAIANTTGSVVVLCDQDDVWHDDKIERMLAALGDGLLVFSDAALVDAAGRPLGGAPTLFDGLGLSDWERASLAAGDAWPVLLRRNVVTGATALFRRELLELAGEFPAAWVHDEWLAAAAAAHRGLRLLDAPTIDYRQHAGNQIGMRSRLDWGTRWQRLSAPRRERNARLRARAEALAARAAGWPAPAATDAAAKLAHERVRSSLPAARALRVVPVLREWRTGRYQRFGLGAADLLRDLVQPADAASRER